MINHSPKAIIISIGDEIMIGQILDTNSQWLSQQLTTIGFIVSQKLSIPDIKEVIENEVLNAWNDYDLVITTGGLGPTNDDLTVESIAHAFNSDLIYDQSIEDHIQNLFQRRGRVMNDLNKKQALIPDGFSIIWNDIGTAPGLLRKNERKMLAVFPGVPVEMKEMFNNHFKNVAIEHFKVEKLNFKTILTMGIGESVLADKLKDWESKLPSNIKLAYLPSFGSVRLRLNGLSDSISQEDLENQFLKIVPLLGKNLVAWNDYTPEKALAEYLKYFNLSLSTAESCTGGALSSAIVSISGSSSFFKGSVVAYSNEVKMKILGVNPSTLETYGAVSEECVNEMSMAVSKLFDTDISISISGIAGPEGGTESKPVGTVWLSLFLKNELSSKKLHLTNLRDYNIKASVNQAIFMILEALNNQFGNQFLFDKTETHLN
ncbi:MAG: CinA family nicotinamide mononucleotide deamidase-related protein [Cytophagales bacterium]